MLNMVAHASAHSSQQTPEANDNNVANSFSKVHTCSKAPSEPPPKIPDIAPDTTIPPEMSYPLAEGAHIPSGHKGSDSTH